MAWPAASFRLQRQKRRQPGNSLPWLNDLAAGREKARSENKPLLVDAWAEWCAACRELDEKTFSRPEVQAALRDYVLVKLDFTRKSEVNERLKKELGIIGMPTVIFFDCQWRRKQAFLRFSRRRGVPRPAAAVSYPGLRSGNPAATPRRRPPRMMSFSPVVGVDRCPGAGIAQRHPHEDVFLQKIAQPGPHIQAGGPLARRAPHGLFP